jgi:hypothetical protein
MERGPYIAASGMVAEQMRQDQIAAAVRRAGRVGSDFRTRRLSM